MRKATKGAARIELFNVPKDDKRAIEKAADLDGRSVSSWGGRTLSKVAREEIAAAIKESEASP